MFAQNSQKKKILISVGTTEFEDLIKFTDSKQFLGIVSQVDKQIDGQKTSENKKQSKQQSFNNFQILYQIGSTGKYIPKSSDNYFRLSDNISDIYKSADFIICHGGAGTLLENLHNGKQMIAIANNTLKGNHQLQLVQKLSKQKHVIGFSSVEQLQKNTQQIKSFLFGNVELNKYQRTKRCIMNQIIFD